MQRKKNHIYEYICAINILCSNAANNNLTPLLFIFEVTFNSTTPYIASPPKYLYRSKVQHAKKPKKQKEKEEEVLLFLLRLFMHFVDYFRYKQSGTTTLILFFISEKNVYKRGIWRKGSKLIITVTV